MSNGLTIIICATNLANAYNVCKNVEYTSKCKCQFLIHDNIRDNYSLAKTYNMYSRIAKYENILFAHQDIRFLGNTWFDEISKKLEDPTCGCIGFAGSVYRHPAMYGGWAINAHLSRCNYIDNHNRHIFTHRNDMFDEVVNVDGLAIFVQKKTVLQYPFDEIYCSGFHCYDLDFSMTLHIAGKKNFIYVNKENPVFHQSYGNYSTNWVRDTIRITKDKWSKYDEMNLSDDELNDSDKNDLKLKIVQFRDLAKRELPYKEYLIVQSIMPNIKQNACTCRNDSYIGWN